MERCATRPVLEHLYQSNLPLIIRVDYPDLIEHMATLIRSCYPNASMKVENNRRTANELRLMGTVDVTTLSETRSPIEKLVSSVRKTSS